MNSAWAPPKHQPLATHWLPHKKNAWAAAKVKDVVLLANQSHLDSPVSFSAKFHRAPLLGLEPPSNKHHLPRCLGAKLHLRQFYQYLLRRLQSPQLLKQRHLPTGWPRVVRVQHLVVDKAHQRSGDSSASGRHKCGLSIRRSSLWWPLPPALAKGWCSPWTRSPGRYDPDDDQAHWRQHQLTSCPWSYQRTTPCHRPPHLNEKLHNLWPTCLAIWSKRSSPSHKPAQRLVLLVLALAKWPPARIEPRLDWLHGLELGPPESKGSQSSPADLGVVCCPAGPSESFPHHGSPPTIGTSSWRTNTELELRELGWVEHVFHHFVQYFSLDRMNFCWNNQRKMFFWQKWTGHENHFSTLLVLSAENFQQFPTGGSLYFLQNSLKIVFLHFSCSFRVGVSMVFLRPSTGLPPGQAKPKALGSLNCRLEDLEIEEPRLSAPEGSSGGTGSLGQAGEVWGTSIWTKRLALHWSYCLRFNSQSWLVLFFFLKPKVFCETRRHNHSINSKSVLDTEV